MLKKILIIGSIIVMVIVLVVIGQFTGNPFTKAMVSKEAEKYIQEKYKGQDFEITEVAYNFKDGSYPVHVKSKSSADTHFLLSFKADGSLDYDYYDQYVENKFNVFTRLNSGYRKYTDSVLNTLEMKLDYAYGGLVIIENEPEFPLSDELSIPMKDLVLDKEYDIKELGKECGKINICIEDEEVSYEKFAEHLLNIKSKLDENGINFATIDMVLRGKYNNDRINVNLLHYEDIKEEGLIDHIKEQHKKSEKYWDKIEK